MKVTHTDFIFLHAKDFAQSAEFYTKTLGLEQSKNYSKMPGGEFETGNLTLQILDHKAMGQEFTPAQAIAFRVDDVATARAELEKKGVTFMTDTIDSGVCHMAFFRDPAGNPLILHNRYAAEGEEPPPQAEGE
jgi:predicted enzyme related to lactoylglutathione lyase